jgi:hypothetical protein
MKSQHNPLRHASVSSLTAGFLLCIQSAALAGGGQANIEQGLPLQFEDTVPQEYLGREFQLVSRYERTDEGEDRYLLEPRLELGIWHNTQLTVATPFLFGDADEGDGLGPVELDLLYNINQETLDLPAFAIKAGADFTGAAEAGGGDGVDPFIGILMDRTIGDSSLYQKVHINALYQFNGSQLDDERDGRYEVAIGYSRRLGATTMLVADLVRYQEMEDNVEVNLAEIGLRYAILPQSVISGGVGFGIGDESPDLRVTLGFQYEF